MSLQRTACLIAAIAALVACPVMARADEAQTNRYPFSLEFGTYFPTNGNTQLFIHTVYAMQVNYDLGQAKGAAAPLSVYGQYGWGSHAPVSGVNVNYQLWSVGVDARTRSQTYAGLGLGYYGQSGTVNVSGFGSGSASQGGIGGSIFVGTDFAKRGAPGPGLRVGYNLLPNFQGLNTNSWSAGVTYRL
jgi:hypothetical protein